MKIIGALLLVMVLVVLGGCHGTLPKLTHPADHKVVDADLAEGFMRVSQMQTQVAATQPNPVEMRDFVNNMYTLFQTRILPHRKVEVLADMAFEKSAMAVQQDDAQTHKDLTKEQTSWFGGRIGHLLWYGLWGSILFLAVLALVKGGVLAASFAGFVPFAIPLIGHVLAWLYNLCDILIGMVWRFGVWVEQKVIAFFRQIHFGHLVPVGATHPFVNVVGPKPLSG